MANSDLNTDLPNDDTPTSPPAEAYFPLAGYNHTTETAALSIVPAQGVLILRGNQEDYNFQNWFKTYFDAECPAVGQTVRRDGLSVVWQGPDQLLICCDQHSIAQNWYEKLHSQRPSTPWVSLIDVSDYYYTIQIKSNRGFDILRQSSPYDFSQLHTGQAIFTHLAHANILVDYIALDSINIMVRISYAQYTWDHLVYASDQLPHFA